MKLLRISFPEIVQIKEKRGHVGTVNTQMCFESQNLAVRSAFQFLKLSVIPEIEKEVNEDEIPLGSKSKTGNDVPEETRLEPKVHTQKW